MKVHVEGNLYIESDSMQFIIREYTGRMVTDKRTGVESEVVNNLAYYKTLEGCANYLLRKKMRETTATTLGELRQDVRDIKEWLTTAFDFER